MATRHNWWLEEVHAGVCHAVTTTGAAHGTVRLSWEPAMRESTILSELIDHIRNSLVPHPLDASAVGDLEVNCVFFLSKMMPSTLSKLTANAWIHISDIHSNYWSLKILCNEKKNFF